MDEIQGAIPSDAGDVQTTPAVADTGAASTPAEAFTAFFNQAGTDPDTNSTEGEDEGRETATPDPEPEEPLFTVKVNGEERQITQAELVAAYQKGAGADEKFEKAATLRKEAEAIQAKYDAEARQLESAIAHFTQIAEQWQVNGLLTPPSVELAASDPGAYIREKAAYDARVQELQKAHAAQAHLEAESERKQAEARAAHLAAESARLPQLLPEWADESKANAEQAELVQYLKKTGYSDHDIQELSYSRADNIALVVKAMRYDALANKAKAAKTNPPAPKVVGAQPSGVAVTDGRTQGMQRLKKSGSLKDAANLFSQI